LYFQTVGATLLLIVWEWHSRQMIDTFVQGWHWMTCAIQTKVYEGWLMGHFLTRPMDMARMIERFGSHREILHAVHGVSNRDNVCKLILYL
jgi:hypothetical protein